MSGAPRPASGPAPWTPVEYIVPVDDQDGAVPDLARFSTERFLGDSISAVVLPSGSPERLRPVLLLHGNSSTKLAWAHQIAALGESGRAVLAPDLPGHGNSRNAANPEQTYNLPGYAAVVGALLDVLQWSEVDVVGWSLGGHIGLELLATDHRVRSLVIVGTPPGRPAAASLAAAFHASDRMELAGKETFSPADALAYGSSMMGGSRRLAPELFAQVLRTDGLARRCLFDSVLRGVGTDQRATVETVDKPLAVIQGEREPFVRLDYLRSLNYRALWNERIYVIADAGHAPHWECPQTFNRLLLAFLLHQSPGDHRHFAVANSRAPKR